MLFCPWDLHARRSLAWVAVPFSLSIIKNQWVPILFYSSLKSRKAKQIDKNIFQGYQWHLYPKIEWTFSHFILQHLKLLIISLLLKWDFFFFFFYSLASINPIPGFLSTSVIAPSNFPLQNLPTLSGLNVEFLTLYTWSLGISWSPTD